MDYHCGHCGYVGVCYGEPTEDGVGKPRCYMCHKNDRLSVLDPSKIHDKGHGIKRPDYRVQLEELGGWKDPKVSVPAGSVRPIIEEVEELREHNVQLRLALAVIDHRDASYLRRWVEVSRGESTIPDILNLCNDALRWRKERDSAKKMCERAMSHYDAEGLMGALGENMAKALGMDNEDKIMVDIRKSDDLKAAIKLLRKFRDLLLSFQPKKCPQMCDCLFCEVKQFVDGLPGFLRAEYMGKYDEDYKKKKDEEEDEDES